MGTEIGQTNRSRRAWVVRCERLQDKARRSDARAPRVVGREKESEEKEGGRGTMGRVSAGARKRIP